MRLNKNKAHGHDWISGARSSCQLKVSVNKRHQCEKWPPIMATYVAARPIGEAHSRGGVRWFRRGFWKKYGEEFCQHGKNRNDLLLLKQTRKEPQIFPSAAQHTWSTEGNSVKDTAIHYEVMEHSPCNRERLISIQMCQTPKKNSTTATSGRYLPCRSL